MFPAVPPPKQQAIVRTVSTPAATPSQTGTLALVRSQSAPAALSSLTRLQRADPLQAEFAVAAEAAGACAVAVTAQQALASRISTVAAAYLRLRELDKRRLFVALDQQLLSALAGRLGAPQLKAFKQACREIFVLEAQALALCMDYVRVFQQLQRLPTEERAAIAGIDWLAGGRMPVVAEEELSAIDRLLDVEHIAKSTQAEVFGRELDRIFEAGLSAQEQVIVARAAQRLLNALTLVLNSSQGAAALVNLRALETLLMMPFEGDSTPTPPTAVWPADSVRALLLPRLEALLARLQRSGQVGSLSEQATAVLQQACRNIVAIVSAYPQFDVPPALGGDPAR